MGNDITIYSLSMKKFLKIFSFIAIFAAFFFFAARSDKGSGFFDPARAFFRSLSDAYASREEIIALRLENQSLSRELAVLMEKSEKAPDYHYKTAAVYSRYPSNDRSSIVISIGTEDGVVPGMPVMVRDGVLFGKIRSVARTQSEVETIFSPRWKSSVRIGATNAKAVLQGGAVPSITLISKEESVREGESVVNISPEFPLYASLGKIESLESSPNDVWQHGMLEISYELQDISSVFVLLDFP